MEFTYKSYGDLVEQLKINNYEICSYHDHEKYDRCAILRHDVDNSLEKAVAMAELEYNLKVKSTYFILISSDFYNIASKKSCALIYKIHRLGHEIGLHFDEVKYGNNSKQGGVLPVIKQEAKIMSETLGIEIKSVSMHRPSKETLEANYQLEGLVNSYGKEFFEGFKYVSDSRRNWREDVKNIIASKTFEKLHILTHAFWYNEYEKTLTESVREYVNGANWDRYLTMQDNIRDLEEIMPVNEVKK